jgi:hypothetical protein
MKYIFSILFLFCISSLFAQNKKKTWVFILAGQSNMAGRGAVEVEDTITHPRIKTIDKNGNIILAKEPLHFYEPTMAGLDCGLSFAKALIKDCPDDVNILLIPAAVGGSNIRQWLGDSVHRGVKLLSNFKEKTALARQYGTIKGILWHQGEGDANEKGMPVYKENMQKLFGIFRAEAGKKKLPILLGELGAFNINAAKQFKQINQIIWEYASADKHTAVIATGDLGHKGDNLHFNAAGQRAMGIRYAKAYWSLRH